MGEAFMVAGARVVLPRSLVRTIRLAIVVLELIYREGASQIAMHTREFNCLDLGMGAAGALFMMVILSLLYFVSILFAQTGINTEHDIQR
jgi:hypothetical protein